MKIFSFSTLVIGFITLTISIQTCDAMRRCAGAVRRMGAMRSACKKPSLPPSLTSQRRVNRQFIRPYSTEKSVDVKKLAEKFEGCMVSKAVPSLDYPGIEFYGGTDLLEWINNLKALFKAEKADSISVQACLDLIEQALSLTEKYEPELRNNLEIRLREVTMELLLYKNNKEIWWGELTIKIENSPKKSFELLTRINRLFSTLFKDINRPAIALLQKDILRNIHELESNDKKQKKLIELLKKIYLCLSLLTIMYSGNEIYQKFN